MNWNKLSFDAKDFLKGLVLVGGFMTQFFLLKQEIHDNKTFDEAEKQVINYRLGALEQCCDKYFVKPKEISLTYKK